MPADYRTRSADYLYFGARLATDLSKQLATSIFRVDPSGGTPEKVIATSLLGMVELVPLVDRTLFHLDNDVCAVTSALTQAKKLFSAGNVGKHCGVHTIAAAGDDIYVSMMKDTASVLVFKMTMPAP